MNDPVLSAVGNNGGCITIEHDGHVYKLHKWTDRLRAKYIRWSHKHLIENLRKTREFFSQEEYDKQMTSLTARIAEGEYSFGKKSLERLCETEAGTKALILILLNDDMITDEMLDSFIESKGKEIKKALFSLNGIKEEPESEDDEGKS